MKAKLVLLEQHDRGYVSYYEQEGSAYFVPLFKQKCIKQAFQSALSKGALKASQ